MRFRRLGSFLRALQLPWVAMGDWNITPQYLQSSGFLQEVGGQIRCADVEYTCDPGGGKKASHLDYLVHSYAATPYIKHVEPLHDVPWKPHIALLTHFVSSGEQLLTRIMELPRRLPTSVRPSKAPTPGSKSSKAKAQRAEKATRARELRDKTYQAAFGDLWGGGAEEDGTSTRAGDSSDDEHFPV